MLNLLLTALIITAADGEPTEVIGTAAQPDGERKEVIIEQPEDDLYPFGYIAPSNPSQPTVVSPPESASSATLSVSEPQPEQTAPALLPLVSQSSEVYPQDRNPLDYRNQIDNTLYQEGNRLIDVQSIPLKDIRTATEPNIQPTVTDYPSW